jgi:hypothetical protein
MYISTRQSQSLLDKTLIWGDTRQTICGHFRTFLQYLNFSTVRPAACGLLPLQQDLALSSRVLLRFLSLYNLATLMTVDCNQHHSKTIAGPKM